LDVRGETASSFHVCYDDLLCVVALVIGAIVGWWCEREKDRRDPACSRRARSLARASASAARRLPSKRGVGERRNRNPRRRETQASSSAMPEQMEEAFAATAQKTSNRSFHLPDLTKRISTDRARDVSSLDRRRPRSTRASALRDMLDRYAGERPRAAFAHEASALQEQTARCWRRRSVATRSVASPPIALDSPADARLVGKTRCRRCIELAA